MDLHDRMCSPLDCAQTMRIFEGSGSDIALEVCGDETAIAGDHGRAGGRWRLGYFEGRSCQLPQLELALS